VVGLDQHGLYPDLEAFDPHRAGADQRRDVGVGVEILVVDGGRVVGKVRDDCDVGRLAGQAHGVAVDHLDRAIGGLAGFLVDQRGDARGHRVALDRLVAPVGDDAGHVIGGEIVAVVPFHALADIQGVFGGIVVHVPAFDKHAAERAVVVVLDQVFQRARGQVGDLSPVVGARILEGAHLHLHADRAAALGCAMGRRLRRLRQAAKRVSGRGGHAKGGRARQEFAAAQLAGLEFIGVHPRRVVHSFICG
jgi:hypothetical protein